MHTMLRLCCVLLLPAAAVMAQDVERRSFAAGRVSLEFPAAWEVEVKQEEGALLALAIKAPDVGGAALLVYLLRGSRDPLA